MGRALVPAYKPWDIERIAQEFLSKYWDPGSGWVDIEAIIERDLDVVIDYTSLDWPSIVGCISRRLEDGRFVIVVREELPDSNPNRYRFTLAQEVGHLLLHREMLDCVKTREQALELCRSLTADDYRRIESDANWCAGAVLLPQEPFRQAVHEAYRSWFERVSGVGRVMPDDMLKRVIDSMAKLFRVSPDVARIRLHRWPFKLDQRILASVKRRMPFVSED